MSEPKPKRQNTRKKLNENNAENLIENIVSDSAEKQLENINYHAENQLEKTITDNEKTKLEKMIVTNIENKPEENIVNNIDNKSEKDILNKTYINTDNQIESKTIHINKPLKRSKKSTTKNKSILEILLEEEPKKEGKEVGIYLYSDVLEELDKLVKQTKKSRSKLISEILTLVFSKKI